MKAICILLAVTAAAVVLLFFIAGSVVNAISGSSYIGSRGRNAVQLDHRPHCRQRHAGRV